MAQFKTITDLVHLVAKPEEWHVQLVLTPINVAFFGLYIYSIAPFPSFWSNQISPSLVVWGKTTRKYTRKVIVIKQTNPTRMLMQGNSCRQCV